jgi:hypothetical protein
LRKSSASMPLLHSHDVMLPHSGTSGSGLPPGPLEAGEGGTDPRLLDGGPRQSTVGVRCRTNLVAIPGRQQCCEDSIARVMEVERQTEGRDDRSHQTPRPVASCSSSQRRLKERRQPARPIFLTKMSSCRFDAVGRAAGLGSAATPCEV